MSVTLSIVLGVVLLLAALFLIVAILLQNGKSKGTGVVTGGAETFFGKNKAKSIDKKLSTLTVVVAILFILIVISVFVVEKRGWFDQDTSTSTSTSTNTSSNTSSDTSSDTEHDASGDHDHDGDGVPDHE